jgi:hypothetical protein
MMTKVNSAPQGVISVRALTVFLDAAAYPFGNDHPRLAIKPDQAVFKPDYGYVRVRLYDNCDTIVHLGADNRFVRLHAPTRSGIRLAQDRKVIQSMMPLIPGTSIEAMQWKDYSFRLGYRLTQEAKQRPEDARLILIHRCLLALADAAERFAAFETSYRTDTDRVFTEDQPEAA